MTLQVDERTGQVLQAAHARDLAAAEALAAVPEARDLMACVRSLGGWLRPVHPGTNDPELVRFFEVDIPEPAAADAALTALQGCRGVRAAYVKPPDAPPL